MPTQSNRVRAPLAVAVMFSLHPFASPARAQQQADDIAAPSGSPVEEVVVVSSRNRVEDLQDVPISIAVVSGERLEQIEVTDINEIVLRAGNVSWNQGNQRTSSLSIRGIGKQGQTEAQDPSVGVIVDGVNYAYNALTSSFDFTDVERVEVVRGPQGTLLGKNTSLGVINVMTRRPSFEPSVDYSVVFGDRDTVRGRIAGGGGIIDDVLAWRGSLSLSKGKGYLSDPYNPDQTYRNTDRASGRLQLLIEPRDSALSARVALDITPRAGEATNGRSILVPPPKTYADGSPVTTTTNEDRLRRPWFEVEGFSLDDYYYGGRSGGFANIGSSRRPLVTGSRGATVELNWDGLERFSLTSITAYRDYHFNAWNDEGTPFDVYRNSGGFWNDYEQITQELRVSSATGGKVDYQAGLYFITVHNTADYRREWGTDAGAWFASNSQYARLDVPVNPDGSVSGGRLLLRNSLAGLRMSYDSPAGVQDIRNRSAAIFGQANWHLTDRLDLTTGVRFTRENRRNVTRSMIKDNGAAPELNVASINGVWLGGFDSDPATGALTGENGVAQLELADLVANKYFGVPISTTPGEAYAALTPAQQRQVADAKAIRQRAIGPLFDDVYAEPFKDTQPAFLISPSFRINDNVMTYVSWQYGEKAGISQTTNGVSNLAVGEKTSSVELGVKANLLDSRLVMNMNLFRMDVDNYQQGVQIVDEYTTALNRAAGNTEIVYTTATGNVPKVRAEGIELDGTYAVSSDLRLSFSVAYSDAYYVEFPNAAQPDENGYEGAPPYRDVSGHTLPGASKLNGSIGFDYRRSILEGKELFASGDLVYNGKFNSSNQLSDYGWVPARRTADVVLGVGREDGTFDVALLVKNLFDDDTPLSRSWTDYVPPEPRWYGVRVTGRL